MNRKRLVLTMTLAVLVLVGALAWLLVERPAASRLSANPNAYNEYTRAASLTTMDVSKFQELNIAELRGLVSSNAEALRLVHAGLEHDFLLPTEAFVTNVGSSLNWLSDAKRLAQLLAAQGRLQELEGRPAEAALTYAGIIRFGNEISRGGMVIHRLVGVACQAIGCSPLARLVPVLDSDQSRPVIAQLQQVEAWEIPWAEVMINERRFMRAQRRSNPNPIFWLVSWWNARDAIARAEARDKRLLAHVRLVELELALRCYRASAGAPPSSLNALVPGDLRSIPADPFTGNPLIYRPKGTNWLLYSVGLDKKDDGGKRAGRGFGARGDIFYDSGW